MLSSGNGYQAVQWCKRCGGGKVYLSYGPMAGTTFTPMNPCTCSNTPVTTSVSELPCALSDIDRMWITDFVRKTVQEELAKEQCREGGEA